MAWFKKKRSPIEQRLNELDDQIAALENQLRRQQQEEEEAARRAAQESTPAPPSTEPDSGNHREPAPAAPKPTQRPRFRTTVTPRGVSPVHGIEPHEVDFFARRDKPVDFSLEAGNETPSKPAGDRSPAPPTESTPPGFVEQVGRLFGRQKPPEQTERLANFLSTGSFQRIKPLKYEKRVARNRFFVLLMILVVVGFILYSCITR